MKHFIKFALVCALVLNFTSADQQHLVCKTIDDVFADDVDSESSSRIRRLQGPPGKTGIAGSPGIQGPPGPSGPPADVDYDRINQVVAEKVASAVVEMSSRITELERNVTQLLSVLPLVRCSEKNGLYYQQKCFTARHISSSRDINRDQAVAECKKNGALLAEIHDQAQQTALHDFAFTKMPSGRSHVYLWVGMEYQSSTSTLLYRSGKQIPTSRFQLDSGAPSGSHRYLLLEVGNDGDSSVGLWNYVDSYYTDGVLCKSA